MRSWSVITALVMGKGNQLRRITLDEGTNPGGCKVVGSEGQSAVGKFHRGRKLKRLRKEVLLKEIAWNGLLD